MHFFFLQGELKGFDQTTNVILTGSTERVYSLEEGVEEVELGLYIVRGDNIVCFFSFAFFRPLPSSCLPADRIAMMLLLLLDADRRD